MKRLLLTALLLSTSIAWAGSNEDAFAAVSRGDFATALKLWRPLAEQGNVAAQTNLGYMYENGDGVQRDYQQAVSLYRKAAQQGHAKAQFNLGRLYYNGHGVKQDYQQAVVWHRKAAQQGHPQAQLELGTMYYDGLGVHKDYVRAHMWSDLVASSLGADGKSRRDLSATPMSPAQIKADGETASKNRAIVARKMSTQKIAEAQKLAQECQARNFKNCD